MGLAKVYPFTKFEVSSFTGRFKDTAQLSHAIDGWLLDGYACLN